MKLYKKIFIFFILAGFVGFLFIFIINFYIYSKSKHSIYSNVEKAPKSYTALILGARVNGGQLSDILSDRAKTALELYQKEKVEKILVSGDHGREEYDEVNAVKDFLINKGVSPQDIFLDHAGFDTYDSIYRAKEIFKVGSIIIVTQNFHLPRAVYIGKKLGIKEVSGVSADRHLYVGAFYYKKRELLSRVKAFFNVAFKTKPKFLGKEIPINGDGRDSWD